MSRRTPSPPPAGDPGTNRTVWAFALASVAVHALAVAVVPNPPARATAAMAPVAFEVVAAPAPEPVPPEPEATPEPEPEPKPVARPEPPATPEPPPAPSDAPPPPLGATDLVDETTDAIETDTVASTEGGLAVRARAGEGGGIAPTRAGRAGDPQGLREAPVEVDLGRLRRAWMIHVQRRLMRLAAQDYPLAARRASMEGTVTLSLDIDPRGQIIGVRVARSSGHGVLDDAAVASADALGRVPAPPEALAWATRPVRFPISYRIR